MRELIIEKIPTPSYYDETGNPVWINEERNEYFPIKWSARNNKKIIGDSISGFVGRELNEETIRDITETIKQKFIEKFYTKDSIFEVNNEIIQKMNEDIERELSNNFDVTENE